MQTLRSRQCDMCLWSPPKISKRTLSGWVFFTQRAWYSSLITLRYVETLLHDQELLSAGLQELYKRTQGSQTWLRHSPEGTNNEVPSTHRILEQLGLLSKHGQSTALTEGDFRLRKQVPKLHAYSSLEDDSSDSGRGNELCLSCVDLQSKASSSRQASIPSQTQSDSDCCSESYMNTIQIETTTCVLTEPSQYEEEAMLSEAPYWSHSAYDQDVGLNYARDLFTDMRYGITQENQPFQPNSGNGENRSISLGYMMAEK